ncbi:hypothetical protein [Parapedobacter tibetensis]|uniref:hypothetical protein n=1 Tax=Parapedobacter tibetensis TaxID=2972951 RepID=UPI00214D5235|nr:hypothetical protein [Parapedobacter tibetensis]
MNITPSILIIATILLLSSCSCLRVLMGRIKDRETQQPIKTARITVTNKGYHRYFESDSTGYFESFLTGGYRCPRIHARIEADGYKPLDIKEPRKRDTITVYLEKLE